MRNSRPGLRAEVAPFGKSVVSHVAATTTITPKLTATDTFTTLNNWVTIYGTPTITSGVLTGTGAVRYKNQALTDHHKASAVVSSKASGTTRLVICGDENFTRFYSLEINVGLTTEFSLIKGSAASSVQEGNDLLALLLNLLLFVFTLFSTSTSKFATTTVTLNVSDEVAVEYDPDTSTLITYINDLPTACTLEVPRGEIGHKEGFRYAGVAVGIASGTAGTRFTSFELADV